MIPWENKIKNIESYFGSVVASYFTFLRWLFWINFVMALICGVVIIMPEVLFGPEMGTVDYKSVPGIAECPFRERIVTRLGIFYALHQLKSIGCCLLKMPIYSTAFSNSA